MDPSILNSPGVQAKLQQIQQSPLLQTLFAPYLQPGAQFGVTQAQLPLTQQETQTSAQAAATSGQEQKNLEAQNPGITAQTQISQIEAKQKAAPMNLNTDLKNRMTLSDAISKYTAFNMNPDDIFRQYNAVNSQAGYGPAKENPYQLNRMGISQNAIGQIGQKGSYADIDNMRSAILGLRHLESLWNQTTPTERLLGVGKNVQAYDAARQVFGQHLSSLIPGAPGAQASGQALLNTIPSSKDLLGNVEGAAAAKFGAVEDQLLGEKQYNTKMLGITPRGNGGAVNQGGNLDRAITDIMSGRPVSAGGDVLNQILGVGPNATPQQKIQAANDAFQNRAGVGGFNTALATSLIGPALGIGAKTAEATGATGGLPGALKTFLNPGKAISQGGNVRTQATNLATNAGNIKLGDTIAKSIRGWFNSEGGQEALSQYPKIAEKIENIAKSYEGKTYTPNQLKGIYDKIENTFTKSGTQYTAQDKALSEIHRQILSKEIGSITQGWQEATTSMAKGYQAAQSPVRAGVKNLAKYGLALGIPSAGADILSHYLFGK